MNEKSETRRTIEHFEHIIATEGPCVLLEAKIVVLEASELGEPLEDTGYEVRNAFISQCYC